MTDAQAIDGGGTDRSEVADGNGTTAGRGMSRGLRWALTAVATLVSLNLLIAGLDLLTPTPSGPPGSSYATAPDGAAACADLLRRRGHAVRRLREGPATATLDPAGTLIVLDPDGFVQEDARALRRFAAAGGRLVLAVEAPGRWLRTVVDDAPTWSANPTATATPLVPVPETSGVERVRTDLVGSWSRAGAGLPVLGAPGRILMIVTAVGSGRVTLLADPSPLRNRLLASDDNAALGLALAGTPGRPVQFLESVHGYGGARGLAALPTSWKWALITLLLAGLVWIASRIRRLGPAQEPARVLPPPRRAYVDAVAATLARTRRSHEASEPVRQAAREQLARRAGLRADADEEAIARAALRIGLPADEAQALTGRPDGSASVLAAGRALARLTGAQR